MRNRRVILLAAAVVGVLIGVGMFLVGPSTQAAPSENATFVGASKCKKCHSKVFRQWKKTEHAQNFEILVMMGKETDPECVKCHSTAYGEPSGFKDIESTPNLAGTTCEACHGPGSEHIENDRKDKEKARATISVPKNECTQCHNPHEMREAETGKEALPVLKKKLEELQQLIAEIEAQ